MRQVALWWLGGTWVGTLFVDDRPRFWYNHHMNPNTCKICRRHDCQETGVGEHLAARGALQPELTPGQLAAKYRLEVEAAVRECARVWN